MALCQNEDELRLNIEKASFILYQGKKIFSSRVLADALRDLQAETLEDIIKRLGLC
jgi:hypothetical protein